MLHHAPTIDVDRFHRVVRRRICQVGDDRFGPRRLEGRMVESEQGKIGALADLDRTDLPLLAEGARPFDGREVEQLLGRERGGVPAMVLLDKARQVDLPQHRERVVGGDRVGAQSDRGPGRAELDHRSNSARGELQVGAHAVGDSDPRAREAGDLGPRQPDRVRGHLTRTEEADLSEPVGGPSAGLRLMFRDLLAGLREVVVEERPLTLRHVPSAQPGLCIAHVDALGRDQGADAVVVLPAPDERGGVVERTPLLGRHLRVEDGPAEEAAGPELFDRARDGVFEVVQVEKGGRPPEQHLGDPRPRAHLDVRLRPVGVDREEGLEETGQVAVVRDPPEWVHRDVGVEVDEPGDEGPRAGVHDIGAFEGRARPDVGESTLVDPDIHPTHCALRVLAHDQCIAEYARWRRVLHEGPRAGGSAVRSTVTSRSASAGGISGRSRRPSRVRASIMPSPRSMPRTHGRLNTTRSGRVARTTSTTSTTQPGTHAALGIPRIVAAVLGMRTTTLTSAMTRATYAIPACGCWRYWRPRRSGSTLRRGGSWLPRADSTPRRSAAPGGHGSTGRALPTSPPGGRVRPGPAAGLF